MDAENLHVILGLGKSGFACAQYLASRNIKLAVTDTRANPPYLAQMQQSLPHVPLYLGGLNHDIMRQAEILVISPGLSLLERSIADCAQRGIPIVGDVELFVRAIDTPVVAITGTNAKSTVTTLVGEMAATAGKRVRVGGNLGTPVLSLLTEDACDLYVLELSSFQLETTYSLRAAVSTVLNISPDHMNRYRYLSEYIAAKQHIYHNAQHVVVNRDDALTHVAPDQFQHVYSFGVGAPKTPYEFGLLSRDKQLFLARGEHEYLFPVNELKIKGEHNWMNALAALALGAAIDLPMQAMLDTLKTFPGLLHRCQWLGSKNNVTWYNDSKGTNVGASLAAIEGLGKVTEGKLILIAGGQAKGASFSGLQASVARYVKHLLVFGEDAKQLIMDLKEVTAITTVADLAEAVHVAKTLAEPGDAVLLSPACASFDMFRDFEHRGEVFMQLVADTLAK